MDGQIRDAQEHSRECCLAQPGAWADWPFGEESEVFKVRGRPDGPARMFALISGHRLNLKCDPEDAVRLRAAHEFIEPGWHMSKRHWNTVRLDLTATDEHRELVRELIEDSWDLVVEGLPRTDRERLAMRRTVQEAR